MILKSNDHRFPLVSGGFPDFSGTETPSVNQKSSYQSGDYIPSHSHPVVMTGYILSGIYLMRFEEIDEILVGGDSYLISAGTEHALDVLEGGEIIEFNQTVS